MDIYKIVALLLISCFAAVLLSQYKKEYGVAIAVACGCAVSFFALKGLYSPISQIAGILKDFGLKNEYIKVTVKVLVIGYISKFTADTCNDCGQTSLASKAEFTGKAVILVLVLPILSSVFNTIYGLIK